MDEQTFGAAIEAATSETETFDLSAVLALLISNNALTDLKD